MINLLQRLGVPHIVNEAIGNRNDREIYVGLWSEISNRLTPIMFLKDSNLALSAPKRIEYDWVVKIGPDKKLQ